MSVEANIWTYYSVDNSTLKGLFCYQTVPLTFRSVQCRVETTGQGGGEGWERPGPGQQMVTAGCSEFWHLSGECLQASGENAKMWWCLGLSVQSWNVRELCISCECHGTVSWMGLVTCRRWLSCPGPSVPNCFHHFHVPLDHYSPLPGLTNIKEAHRYM